MDGETALNRTRTFLITCALNFWRNTSILCPGDYVALMSFLSRIDDALEFACAPGQVDSQSLGMKVRAIRGEARGLSGWMGSSEIRKLYDYTALSESSQWRTRLTTNHIPERQDTGDRGLAGEHVAELAITLLAAYKGILPKRFGVLDHPTLRYSSPRESNMGFDRPSTLADKISFENNPRVHLLASSQHQSRLYTLIKPTEGTEIMCKDNKATLHSCSDIWRQYDTAEGQCGWKLYQLRRNAQCGLDLHLMRGKTVQVVGEEPGQALFDVWKDIMESEEKDKSQSCVSWLIELGDLSATSTTALNSVQVDVNLWQDDALIRMRRLGALAHRWKCMPFNPGQLDSKPVLHSVLGNIKRGVRQTKSGEEDSRWSEYYFKDLKSMGMSYSGMHYPQGSEDEAAHRLIYRWSKYYHPNVLPLKGIHFVPDIGVGCVFPGASTQSLLEYLELARNVDRCKLCAQIGSGLEYMHKAGVIHGNLRAANVLISLHGEAIISDPLLLSDGHSQARWAAPEVIKGQLPDRASDVYSLGMTMLEIITGIDPYLGHNDTEVREIVSSGPGYPLPERPVDSIPKTSKYGNKLWGMITQCWSFIPTSRPTMPQVNKVVESITAAGLEPEYDYIYDCHKIVRRLAVEGCENLADQLDTNSFGHQPLFKGGFCDVYNGSLLGSLPVAIKTPRSLLNMLGEDPENIKVVSREIRTWSKCDHPNVLSFLGLADFKGRIGMIAPWMDYGNLPRYLRKALSADRCKLSTEVCEGVAYLHSIGIIHGDLKGDNILVSGEGVAVVSDFGGSLSKGHSQVVTSAIEGVRITYRWAAPELLVDDHDTKAGNKSGYGLGGITKTKESDIYALGMTILQTITDKFPWHWVQKEAEVLISVRSGKLHKRPEEIPSNSQDGDKLWNLLVACWSFEPNKRPNAVEAGDIMREIAPGGLKTYPPTDLGGRCAFFSAS